MRNRLFWFFGQSRVASLPFQVAPRLHETKTCATLLLSRNVHPKIVSELLGHSNVSITLDTYNAVLGNTLVEYMPPLLLAEVDEENEIARPVRYGYNTSDTPCTSLRFKQSIRREDSVHFFA
ncbi:MAG: hypothetical protein ICV68_16355 [Pyrinomonadaceae bacterium]|nr:hypothetical protein [Pyrinomonadaceae bacterium]